MSLDEESTPANAANAMTTDPKSADSNADPEQQISHKRKASPSVSEQSQGRREDAFPKRVKLDENDSIRENGSPPVVGEPDQVSARPADDTSDDKSSETRDRRESLRDGSTPKETPHSGALQYDDVVTQRSPEAPRPALPEPDRRRKFSQEERRRGQRLFGGLLSTLSQTTTSSQQKKRLEIERRQQEKAQQQRVEYDKRRSEKLAKLKNIRQIEQVKFDEQVMLSRRADRLALARNLQTRSEPRIYYRPWELTKAQEDTVNEQIRNAEDATEREAQEFKARKERRLRELGVTVGEPAPCEDANDRVPAPSSKPSHDKDHDEAGDVLVEGEEDTVIY